MRIHLIAVGTRLATWEQAGFETYANRLPRDWRLELTEIPTAKRSKSTTGKRLVAGEGEKMIKALPPNAHIVALDERGEAWSSAELANRLCDWQRDARDVALLIGGPDGLAPPCLDKAERHWSLSKLTLPHGLARVLVAEQIYRAWSIAHRHPYHRA